MHHHDVFTKVFTASHAEDTHNNEEEKKRCEHLANYFAELALQDYEMNIIANQPLLPLASPWQDVR